MKVRSLISTTYWIVTMLGMRLGAQAGLTVSVLIKQEFTHTATLTLVN